MSDTKDAGYRHNGGLFVSPRPGETTHIYDEDKPADNLKSELWRTALCGQSWGKVNHGKSLAANRDKVDCGACLRLLDGR